MVKTISVVMSSLKYFFFTKVALSGGVVSAAETLLNDYRNIIEILKEYSRQHSLYDPLTLSGLHIASCNFDHEGDTTLWSVYMLQYSIALNIYSM